MKRNLLNLLLSALLATVFFSCTKPIEESILGRYHFKMSGNLTFLNIQTCLDDDNAQPDTIGYVGYLLVSQSGQMKILGNRDRYIVNMSVMLGGNAFSFDATLHGDTLRLNPDEAVIGIVPEGSSTTLLSIGTPVLLTMDGNGVMHDQTIMFDINLSGGFSTLNQINGKNYINEYTVVDNNVVCIADKED